MRRTRRQDVRSCRGSETWLRDRRGPDDGSFAFSMADRQQYVRVHASSSLDRRGPDDVNPQAPRPGPSLTAITRRLSRRCPLLWEDQPVTREADRKRWSWWSYLAPPSTKASRTFGSAGGRLASAMPDLLGGYRHVAVGPKLTPSKHTKDLVTDRVNTW